jgi:copper homeostasis protein (lipoprotein)
MNFRFHGAAAIASLLLCPSALAIGDAADAPMKGQRAARYVGMLPCADCAAIRMDLVLHAQAQAGTARYDERLVYVDAHGKDPVLTTTGSWSIVRTASQPAMTLYRLAPAHAGDQPMLLRVEGPRTLRIVDEEGHDQPSPHPQLLWRSQVPVHAPPVILAEADSARTTRLAVGDEIVVRLRSNPATGYRWSIVDDGQAVLGLAASPRYQPDRAQDGMMGAGGADTWRLLAFRPGAGRITFRYHREWEREGDSRTVSFAVEVR